MDRLPLSIDADRLLERIRRLGEVGRAGNGSLTRLAASDADGKTPGLFILSPDAGALPGMKVK